ncbi:MAG TPA: ATP-grasp domain-containing protein, partial [Methylotenera sp.]|nr:ATP-grasp domain-containing protein [Methylotenera sp.]
MNLHEYQAKTLLQKYGIPVPRGQVVAAANEVAAATSEINSHAWVVKAQVHAGGRGKAGGVKVVKSATEAQNVATELLGKTLVTYQNAPDGQPVNQVLIEETLPIARELYLSMLVDRTLERVVVVASVAGGMDIEEIAHTSPEKILQEVCDPLNGL